MAITKYDNFLIENKITDITNTYLDVRGLMTIDNSLTTDAGLIKYIHKYTYSGAVEQLAAGAKNADSSMGAVALTKTPYTVKRYQHTYKYNDVDVMTDPEVLDVMADGAAKVMANEIKSEYFDELAKISNTASQASGASVYEAIVDAIAGLGKAGDEDINDLFIVMGADGRAAVRKDDLFEAAKQGEIVYTGQFGTIAGVPCVFSNIVPTGKVYITEKAAVKFFVKREGTVEQDRDIETKDNTVVYERHGVMALVDETRSCILTLA